MSNTTHMYLIDFPVGITTNIEYIVNLPIAETISLALSAFTALTSPIKFQYENSLKIIVNVISPLCGV